MALVIPAIGDPFVLKPSGGKTFNLKELQSIVGGYIEAVRLTSEEGVPLTMFVNEDGKNLGLPTNIRATGIMAGRLLAGDIIVGDVIVCTRLEAGE